MNQIDLEVREGQKTALKNLLPNERVLQATKTVLSALGFDDVEVSLLITGDSEIECLNDLYRGQRKPTDVLSFSQQDGDGATGSLLGDVVISLDTTLRQAEELEVPAEEEFMRLLIHGILHLAGYDHIEPDEAQEMFAKQNELLSSLLDT